MRPAVLLLLVAFARPEPTLDQTTTARPAYSVRIKQLAEEKPGITEDKSFSETAGKDITYNYDVEETTGKALPLLASLVSQKSSAVAAPVKVAKSSAKLPARGSGKYHIKFASGASITSVPMIFSSAGGTDTPLTKELFGAGSGTGSGVEVLITVKEGGLAVNEKNENIVDTVGTIKEGRSGYGDKIKTKAVSSETIDNTHYDEVGHGETKYETVEVQTKASKKAPAVYSKGYKSRPHFEETTSVVHEVYEHGHGDYNFDKGYVSPKPAYQQVYLVPIFPQAHYADHDHYEPSKEKGLKKGWKKLSAWFKGKGKGAYKSKGKGHYEDHDDHYYGYDEEYGYDEGHHKKGKGLFGLKSLKSKGKGFFSGKGKKGDKGYSEGDAYSHVIYGHGYGYGDDSYDFGHIDSSGYDEGHYTKGKGFFGLKGYKSKSKGLFSGKGHKGYNGHSEGYGHGHDTGYGLSHGYGHNSDEYGHHGYTVVISDIEGPSFSKGKGKGKGLFGNYKGKGKHFGLYKGGKGFKGYGKGHGIESNGYGYQSKGFRKGKGFGNKGYSFLGKASGKGSGLQSNGYNYGHKSYGKGKGFGSKGYSFGGKGKGKGSWYKSKGFSLGGKGYKAKGSKGIKDEHQAITYAVVLPGGHNLGGHNFGAIQTGGHQVLSHLVKDYPRGNQGYGGYHKVVHPTKVYHPLGHPSDNYHPAGHISAGPHPVRQRSKGYKAVAHHSEVHHPVNSPSESYHPVSDLTEGYHPVSHHSESLKLSGHPSHGHHPGGHHVESYGDDYEEHFDNGFKGPQSYHVHHRRELDY